MTSMELMMTLATGLLLVGCITQTDTPVSPDQKEFEQASAGHWKKVFSDSFTRDWHKQWTLDGEVATAVNTPDGIELTAGPEFLNDAHHMVLWTKEQFKGDIQIDYEFTRLDSSAGGVNILYIQATGSGSGPYKKDIAEWADLRRIPAMKLYFDHMNTYHISYSSNANPNDLSDDYIRARRYMPHKTGLEGSDLAPDYFRSGLFEIGVPHRITVIKKDQELFMRVSNKEKTSFFHWRNDKLPPIDEGRIGLRLMFTRASKIKNFNISVPK
jgi:hypothetical protein